MVFDTGRVVAQEESERDYSGVLNTTRYEIVDVLGKGTWGTVYKAKDLITGKFAALKVLTPTDVAQRQMVERGQTPQSVLLNESGEMHACARIVPRSLEVDENGNYFLRMPVMRRFLDDVLDDKRLASSISRRGHGLNYEQVKSYARDLFEGLREMHEIRGDVHADIKPANIALDENDRLYLNDLGTSTCASLEPVGRHSTSRDNRGFEFTRAPECFLGDDHSKKSDVWGAAALVYRMMSNDGQYPLQDELDNAMDRNTYLKQLGSERLRELLRQKIRSKIPREYRNVGKMLEKCLDPDLWKRPNSSEVVKMIDYAVGRNRLLKDAWKLTKRFGVAVGTVVALGYMGYTIATAPEPLPREPPKVSGMLYLENNKENNFDIEELSNLPRTAEGMLTGGVTSMARRATANGSVAFLVDTRAKSLIAGEKGRRGERITETEQDLFDKYATPEEKEGVKNKTLSDFYVIPAVALEAKMNQLREVRGGNVDLEDLLTIIRVGDQKVMYAKMGAKSPHFRDYSKYLIDEEEVDMIKQWLAYIHEGLARK